MTPSDEIPSKIHDRRKGRFAKLQRTLQSNGLAILRDEPGSGAFSDSAILLETLSGRPPTVIDLAPTLAPNSLARDISHAIGVGAPVAIRGLERLDASSKAALIAAFAELRSAGIPTIAVSLGGEHFKNHIALVNLSHG